MILKLSMKTKLKRYVPWYINYVAIPKGSEILNLGTDDLTFR